jgi:hypothetical protein
MKPTCSENCFFKCNKIITNDECKRIFKSYYNSDFSSKRSFITKCSKRFAKRLNLSADSPRNFSFRYYFYAGNKKIRVCKKYFLATLSISEKVVYNAHKNKDLLTGIPLPSKSGKHVKKIISNYEKDFVR